MQKTYNDVIGLNNTLANMSRERWPFGVVLAKNIKYMDKVVIEYNAKREEIVDKYAKRDEGGKILGIMRDVPGFVPKEGETIPQERVKDPKRIDETEWNDRASFDKELFELNAQSIELDLIPVDVNSVYYSMQANRDMTIRQYLDANTEPGLMLYLNEFGFFKNMEM